MSLPLCVNHNPTPATAVLVHVGAGNTIGSGLCSACTTCTDTTCGETGVILEAAYEEPWCQAHKDSFTGQEQIIGPDIVAIDSDRYRELIAQQSGPTW